MQKLSDDEKSKISKIPKICLIGDSNVGKTSIINRYIKDNFSETQPSIGACHNKKKVRLNSQEEIEIEIWDTAGQERFRTLTASYYRGAQGIIIVYDVSDRETFENVRTWIQEIEKYSKPGVCKVLVGNKCDKEAER